MGRRFYFKAPSIDAAGLRRCQLGKWPEPGRIVPPAPDRTPVNRLARLPYARRGDRAAVALRVEARLVPLQPAKGEQATGFAFSVADQPLVVDLQQPLRGQQRAPMPHQAAIGVDPEQQILAIADEEGAARD